MNASAFRHLLIRVLLVPVAALTVLAALLSWALHQVNETARWVDHSDRVIASAYDLSRLIIDQETGLRGYLATRDKQFLAPYLDSEPLVEKRFDALLTQLGPGTAQYADAQKIRADYRTWLQQQGGLLNNFPQPGELETTLLRQKDGMDNMRSEWATFIARENTIRTARNDWSSRVDRFTLFAIIFLSLSILGIILFTTTRTFLRLSELYQSKLDGLEAARRDVHQRQQWLQTTLRSIADAVIACDAAGNITFINAVAERLTGWSEFEAAGQPVSRVFVLHDEATHSPIESPVESARTVGLPTSLGRAALLIRKDGSEICVEDSAAPIRDPEGKMLGVVLVFRDVSAKREADQALVRAERLAAAGRLSASIAHEVNNPLEGLINLLYIARRLDNLQETQDLIEKAEFEVGRVSHITRQALGFYKDTTALAEFNLTDVIKQIIGFYSARAANEQVRLEADVSDGMQMTGSSGEVQQVVSNLLANSLDATPAQGAIRISGRPTKNFRDGTGHGYRIFVADTGCGINRPGLSRLFDAFYTTKENTGTGLGLWVTKQLTEKHGGRLRVRSRSDGARTGTVFSIFLPQVSILFDPAKQPESRAQK